LNNKTECIIERVRVLFNKSINYIYQLSYKSESGSSDIEEPPELIYLEEDRNYAPEVLNSIGTGSVLDIDNNVFAEGGSSNENEVFEGNQYYYFMIYIERKRRREENQKYALNKLNSTKTSSSNNITRRSPVLDMDNNTFGEFPPNKKEVVGGNNYYL